MKTIKLRFEKRGESFPYIGYKGKGYYKIGEQVYFVRANTEFTYLATPIKEGGEIIGTLSIK